MSPVGKAGRPLRGRRFFGIRMMTADRPARRVSPTLAIHNQGNSSGVPTLSEAFRDGKPSLGPAHADCGSPAGWRDVTLVLTCRAMPTNVLGTELQCCCRSPRTGFWRDGFCRTGPGDHGVHVVCAVMTREFLEFSVARGNDLITPVPEARFPGLEPGDRWCLCVSRWKEALDAGCAPPVVLESTHASALEFVERTDLQAHAADDVGGGQ